MWATYSSGKLTTHSSSNSIKMFSHLFSAIYQFMARKISSHDAGPTSVVILLTCFVVLTAVKYPQMLSWLQRVFLPGSSTLGAQPGFRTTLSLAHRHNMQKIEFRDGSSRQRARQRVLEQLIKTKGWEQDTNHPRRRVLAALVGFLEYRKKMEGGVQRKRSAWAKLSARQKEVCFVSLMCRHFGISECQLRPSIPWGVLPLPSVLPYTRCSPQHGILRRRPGPKPAAWGCRG